MSMEKTVRKPAVAGTFYPSSPEELRGAVEKYLADAKAATDASLPPSRVIIAPHAGYVFSAPVAAAAYARVPAGIKTVIILGPSHRQRFDGLRVSDARAYETPLGRVEVDVDIVEKLCADPLCRKARGEEDGEHCLEVHIPFLQVLLDDFKIVPILTGKVDAGAVSKILLPLLDDTVLTIASSDLSHYLPQDRARATDDATVATVLSGDVGGFMDGCGETAMRAVMDIAAKLGMRAELLDARTSFETAPEYGDAGRVVGYASFAFVKEEGRAPFIVKDSNTADSVGTLQNEECTPAYGNEGVASDFTPAEKSYMLGLARQTIAAAVNGGKPRTARPDDPALSRLSHNYGCFVTLHKHGNLRGCIGYIEPVMPLYKAVADNAVSAALRDPRFQPVSARELDDIDIEISVLTKPRPLEFDSPDDLLNKLLPLEHGVILKMGGRQSTFLPQVWEQLPDREAFLEHLSMKAGMDCGAWKDAEVWVYRAVCFGEQP